MTSYNEALQYLTQLALQNDANKSNLENLSEISSVREQSSKESAQISNNSLSLKCRIDYDFLGSPAIRINSQIDN